MFPAGADRTMRRQLIFRKCKHWAKRGIWYTALIFWPVLAVLIFHSKQEGLSSLHFNINIFTQNLPILSLSIPKLSEFEVWTILGIWLILFFLPEIERFAKRLTKLRIGSFSASAEIIELKETSTKITIGDRFIHASLLANQDRWEEAADILLLLRNSDNLDEKITGLVESAFLLVHMYDKKIKFEHHEDSTYWHLKNAINFCDTALWLAKSTDGESNRISLVYFRRAIVYSRMAEIEKCQKLKDKYKTRALGDLVEATEKDNTILRSVAYDHTLNELATGKRFQVCDGEQQQYRASKERKKLTKRFLTLGKEEIR